MSEVRKNDAVEMNRVQNSLKAVAKYLESNAEVQAIIELKIGKIDDTSNQNLERISKLEEKNSKLEDNICLLEEREKRRSTNLKSKVLEPMIPPLTSAHNPNPLLGAIPKIQNKLSSPM